MQSSMPVLDRCSTGSCRPALRSLELRQNDGRARAHLGDPMSFEIVPTGAALGAEIRGANLAGPLNDATFTAIERPTTNTASFSFATSTLRHHNRLPSPAALARSNSTSSAN